MLLKAKTVVSGCRSNDIKSRRNWSTAVKSMSQVSYYIYNSPLFSLVHEITFDALLIGHDAGITSLAWVPATEDGESLDTTLLSTSTDSSVILWGQTTITAHDKTTSLWTNHQRFGDVGGQRLGGFVGGLWGKNGSEVLAWGWSGGWRRWRHVEDGQWQEVAAITGHNAPVRGLAWSPKGEYLLSTRCVCGSFPLHSFHAA
jgi:elongator complex protein 2